MKRSVKFLVFACFFLSLQAALAQSFTVPPANQTVCPGQAVTFTAQIADINLEVNHPVWQSKAPASGDWVTLAVGSFTADGSASLTVATTDDALDAYQYRVYSAENSALISVAATLTIDRTVPAFSGALPAPTDVCVGTDIVLSAPAVTGCLYGYSYVWTCDGVEITEDSGPGGRPTYSGRTTNTLTITNVRSEDHNKIYTCKLKKEGQQVQPETNAVSIRALSVALQSNVKYGCHGRARKTTFEAVITGSQNCITKRRWQSRPNAQSDWTDIPDVTSYHTEQNTNVLTVFTYFSNNQSQYRLKISIGAETQYSEVGTVITIPPISGTESVCDGGSTSFTADLANFTAAGCFDGFQWQYREKDKTAETDWTPITAVGTSPLYADYTTNTLNISNIPSSHNGYQYRCVFRVRIDYRYRYGYSAPLTLKMGALTRPPNQTICLGNNAIFRAPFTERSCISAFRWEYRTGPAADWNTISGVTSPTYAVSEDNSAFVLTISNSTLEHSGLQYRCVATKTMGDEASSDAASLTINNVPAMSELPDQSVCPGDAATFAVSAVDCISAYQWQQRISNTAAWEAISGATTASLSISNISPSDNGYQYRCVATASTGLISSNAATLSVSQPSIAQQGIAEPTQKICPGANASFVASLGTCTIGYQWQYREKDKTLETDWADVSNSTNPAEGYSGATTAALSIVGTPVGHDGFQYRCKFVKDNTTVVATSALLTLGVATPAIAAHPTPQRLCIGGNASFSVSATAPSCITAYQWQLREKDKTAETDWGNISNSETTSPRYSGATAPSLIVQNVAEVHEGYQYRCVLTSSLGALLPSEPALLSTTVSIGISVEPSEQRICHGGAASFVVTANTACGIAYQWQQREKDKTAETDWVDISGTASSKYSGGATPSLTVQNVTAAFDGYQYRCVLTDGSAVIKSRVAALFVNTPAVTTQPSNRRACIGGETSFTAAVGQPSCITAYQWQQREKGKTAETDWTDIRDAGTTPEFSRATTPSLGIKNIAATQEGYQYRCKITFVGGPVFSNLAVLSVNPAVSIAKQPKDITVNPNARALFRVKASGRDLGYQWQALKDGNWEVINKASERPKYEYSTTDSLRVSNYPSAPDPYHFRCQVTDTVCIVGVPSAEVTLTVRKIATGVKELPISEATLQVYPNPASNHLYISLRNAKEGKTLIALYNLSGQVVWKGVMVKSGETLKEEVRIGHLPSGLYLLRATVEGAKPVQTKVMLAN